MPCPEWRKHAPRVLLRTPSPAMILFKTSAPARMTRSRET